MTMKKSFRFLLHFYPYVVENTWVKGYFDIESI